MDENFNIKYDQSVVNLVDKYTVVIENNQEIEVDLEQLEDNNYIQDKLEIKIKKKKEKGKKAVFYLNRRKSCKESPKKFSFSSFFDEFNTLYSQEILSQDFFDCYCELVGIQNDDIDVSQFYKF